MKHSAPGDDVAPRMSKRFRYDSLIDEAADDNERDDDVTQLRSPSPQSTLRRDVREVLEMLDRVEFQVEYLQEKREETRTKHEKEVERYQNRIDGLEEEVRYQQAIIDVISEDVDRLEGETAEQKKDIEEFIELEHRDTIARKKRIAELKEQIAEDIDNANL